MTNVLVAYGTKHGATASIAEEIGKTLSAVGLAVTVLPADEVADTSGYDAVVLGSAVYVGQWRKEAAALLQREEQALASRPVWLFSSGPTGEEEPSQATKGWRFPEKLQPVADRIQPRDIALFHGAIDWAKLGLIEKFLMKNVKAPIGDYRDWDAIRAWARGIAAALQP
jgi:menaquinone-dependent protoporphyrinogen oxidase